LDGRKEGRKDGRKDLTSKESSLDGFLGRKGGKPILVGQSLGKSAKTS